MIRRTLLYLAITLGLLTEVALLQNRVDLSNLSASHLQLQATAEDLGLPTVDDFLPEPTYTPLPKGQFGTPHAKVIRGGRDLWVLEEDFVYIDSIGKEWVAPAGTVTDGASIPQAFLSATGDRLKGDYLDAAVVHDAYCQTGNESLDTFRTESWQYVHYMFYEALLTSGVPEQQAMIMYTAVYLGGPRWGDGSEDLPAIVKAPTSIEDGLQNSQNNGLAAAPSTEPTAEQLAEFEAILAWIDAEEPTSEELRERLEKG